MLPGLQNNDPRVSQRTAEALGNMGAVAADKAAPALRRLLKDADAEVRHAAANALVVLERDDAAVIALVIEELKDRNRSWQAARTLAKCGPAAKAAVPVLIPMLRDEEHMMRGAAATALGGIGPAAVKAVPALVAALKGTDANARDEVIRALGEIGPGAQSRPRVDTVHHP